MQIAERFDYTWGSHTVTIEVDVVDDETVELSDVFGVRDSSDVWVDLEGSRFEALLAAIDAVLEAESADGEWTSVIADAQADAWDDELIANVESEHPSLWAHVAQ